MITLWKTNSLLWKITIFIGKSTISLQFSIAMLSYQWVVIIDHTVYLRWMNTQLYPAFSSYFGVNCCRDFMGDMTLMFATVLRRLFFICALATDVCHKHLPSGYVKIAIENGHL